MLPEQLALAARLLATAFSEPSGWQRRRVETIAFEGDRAQRTITVDADVPRAEHQIPIPIALFRKDEALINADARDAKGRALPLLTRGEAAAVGYVALRLVIADASGELTAEQEEILLDIVTTPHRVAKRAYERLLDLEPAWLANTRVRSLVGLLAAHVVLFALLDSDTSGRQVLKVSWGEIVRGGRLRTLGAGILGLRGSILVMFHGLPTAAPSHLEIAAPYGTEIRQATMLGVGGEIGVDHIGSSRAHLYGPPNNVCEPQHVLVSLSAAGPLVKTAIGAIGLMLLALITAALVPFARDNEAVLVAIISLPVAVLLREAAVLRSRDTGFAGPFVFGPLLLTLVLALITGSFVFLGVNEDSSGWFFDGIGLGLLAQLMLIRGLITSDPSAIRSVRKRLTVERKR